MIEIIQLNISGEDKPGLTTALTSILAQYDATILDIGQENIHKSLTLGILFKTTPEQSGFIMKDLLFKASELGVQIRFTPIEREAYDAWVARQGKNRYIVTLLGRTVTARQIADVTGVIFQYGLNIDAIRRLTGRPPLEGVDEKAAKACIEISVRGMLNDEDRAALKNALLGLPKGGLDISFQKDDIYRRSRRLICFDMDSTLVPTKDNMGLTSWRGEHVQKADVTIAKNYLSKKEIDSLNQIVNMYLDHAERMAKSNIPMHMSDWIEALDEFLKFERADILVGVGKISHALAEQKAHKEYEKYDTNRQLTMSKDLDKELLDVLNKK